jgi:hypothetical protein
MYFMRSLSDRVSSTRSLAVMKKLSPRGIENVDWLQRDVKAFCRDGAGADSAPGIEHSAQEAKQSR